MNVELTIKGEIETLRLRPGDFVVATLGDGTRELPREQMQEVQNGLEDFFARRGVPVFVLVLNGLTLRKGGPS